MSIASVCADLGIEPGVLTGVVDDSRQVFPGALFLAYPGQGVDRRQFIPQALDAGAVAVLWEPGEDFSWKPEWKAPNMALAGLRTRAGFLAHELAGYPSEALAVLAVTGTNGKTTVSQCLAQVFPEPCTVVGTLGAGFPGRLVSTGFTTPEATTLARLLAEHRDQGARACAMEASSIGIAERRMDGVRVDTAIFTNLTQDHLDYHGSMQAYGQAKEELFLWPHLRLAVINLDDPFGQHLAQVTCAEKVLGYTLKGRRDIPAVLKAENIRVTPRGQSFDLHTPWGNVTVTTALVGAYNLSNLLAVAAVLLDRSVDLIQVGELLSRVMPPPGRMESYGGLAQPLVMVDYAHTPDALLNALEVLRPIADIRQGRLLCVFGCGGERDRGKRPVMGQIAQSRADQVWVTNDNPRGEDPLSIIAEIARGAPGVRIEADRAKAIREAVLTAGANDVVLVAGKGHEPYQEIAGVRHPFVDGEQVCLALSARSEQKENGQ